MKSRSPSRDSVTTINEDGSRFFIHAADVSGLWTYARRVVGVIMIAVFVLLPWINIGGHPAVFLDAAHGKFHLFGVTIVSQDLWVLFFCIAGLGLTLYMVTALLGRVWCGWACPQTVFLDHVFRKVERLIDGDATARRKLDAAPWMPGKIFRRVLKHSIYYLLSFAIANMFLSYFVSLPTLYGMMKESPTEHLPMFVFVFTLGGILYGNFAWFREQFCIVLCPYGRLQSAMLDDDSIVIGYDEKRGEPRGKASDSANGDCIDCRRCVQVCPTGIDIRQGLQMECIGCSNCIDACDAIMTKINRPKGLVRYDSMNGLAGKKHRILRPRVVIYAAVMLLGTCLLTYAVTTKLKPVTFSVLRMTGTPYVIDAVSIRNNYMVRIINKNHKPATFTVKATSPQTGLKMSGFEDPVTLPGEGEISSPFIAVVPVDQFIGVSEVTVTIKDTDSDMSIERRIKFLGPDSAIAQ